MNERLNRLIERYRFLLAIVKAIVFCRNRYRRARWLLARSRAIESYFRFHQVRKLQIGAGSNILQGWLNTDAYPTSPSIIYLDVRRPFPLEDCTIDYVFSEHLIEHLTYGEGLVMLRECYRVLKPGGKIRIATPDLETLISLYTSHKSDLQHRYINWIVERFLPEIGTYTYREAFVINNAFRNWGHQFVYDRVTLQSAMEETGFIGVIQYAPSESDDGTLREIESHGNAIDDEEVNRFESMVLEAQRPM